VSGSLAASVRIRHRPGEKLDGGGSRKILDMAHRFLAAQRSTDWARHAGLMARVVGSPRWRQLVGRQCRFSRYWRWPVLSSQ